MKTEENIVIAVTLNCEAARNPGYFTRLRLLAIRVVRYVCRRDPKLTNSSSPAGAASTDEGSPAGSPLPTQVVPERPPQHRDPVRGIYVHPVVLMIREQELGKSILNLGAPITIALLSSGKSRTFLLDFVLIGLSTGCVAIWNGITLRVHVPQTANLVEQLGIAMVLISFNALVASALPTELAWIPVLSGALSLLPLAIAALPRGDVDAANQNAADAG